MKQTIAYLVKAYKDNEAASWRALDAMLKGKGVLRNADFRALLARLTMIIGISAILGIVAQYAFTDYVIGWGCASGQISEEVCAFNELRRSLPINAGISRTLMPCMDNETADVIQDNTSWCYRFIVQQPSGGWSVR